MNYYRQSVGYKTDYYLGKKKQQQENTKRKHLPTTVLQKQMSYILNAQLINED